MFTSWKNSALGLAWARSGLEFLLADSPERARKLSLRGARGQASAAPEGPPPRRGTERVSSQRSERGAVSPDLPTNAAPSVATQTPGLAPDGARILSPENWPAAWISLRQRRPLPPRPKVVWTYAGLGDDLVGEPDKARQQVIVRLLTSLSHPAGTHVFWPHALPGEPPFEGSLFWSGEALLRPRALLVFGPQSAAALGLDPQMTPYVMNNLAGRRVILMPDASDLAQDPNLYARAFPFLSSLLKFCA